MSENLNIPAQIQSMIEGMQNNNIPKHIRENFKNTLESIVVFINRNLEQYKKSGNKSITYKVMH
jgi:hypothetical protein